MYLIIFSQLQCSIVEQNHRKDTITERSAVREQERTWQMFSDEFQSCEAFNVSVKCGFI